MHWGLWTYRSHTLVSGLAKWASLAELLLLNGILRYFKACFIPSGAAGKAALATELIEAASLAGANKIASLVVSFLLKNPLQVNTALRLEEHSMGPIPPALSKTEIIRTRYTFRSQVPALVETSDLEGLPTGLLEIALETLAIKVREIGGIAMPSSILIFNINLTAILEMLIVVQDRLLLMSSC